MEVEEALSLVEQGVYNSTGYIYGDYDPSEVVAVINKMMYRFIENVPSNQLVEIKELINIQQQLNKVSGSGTNKTTFALPDAFFRSIRSYSEKDVCGKTKFVTNRSLYDRTAQDININHLFRSEEDSPVVQIFDNSLIVFDSVDKAYLDFIEHPQLIKGELDENGELTDQQATNLSDDVMYKIVDMAVVHISKISEQSGQKIQSLEQENAKRNESFSR